MVCCYDSSIILAAVLEQDPSATLSSYWDDAAVRLSSILLKIECLVGIRRAASLQGLSADDDWVHVRLDAIKRYTFKPYHDEPIVIVTYDRRMGEVARRLAFPVASLPS